MYVPNGVSTGGILTSLVPKQCRMAKAPSVCLVTLSLSHAPGSYRLIKVTSRSFCFYRHHGNACPQAPSANVKGRFTTHNPGNWLGMVRVYEFLPVANSCCYSYGALCQKLLVVTLEDSRLWMRESIPRPRGIRHLGASQRLGSGRQCG